MHDNTVSKNWKFERISEENARLHTERERERERCCLFFFFFLVFSNLNVTFKALEVLLVIWKAVLNNKVASWEGYTHLSDTKTSLHST